MASKILRLVFVLASVSLSSAAMADEVPVVNAYQYENSNPSNTTQNNSDPGQDQNYGAAQTWQNMPVKDRLTRLEQQMNNQQQMDMPNQIQQLQQEVQQLRGQLQVQGHALKLLKQQDKQLEARNKTDITAAPGTATPISTPAAAAAASIPSTTPTQNMDTSAASTASGSFLSDEASYEAGYNLIAAKKYPAAIAAFNTYIKSYPAGAYVANAHYWLGELYLLQNNDNSAADEFKNVIDNYGSSDKVQGAMLKLGFIYYDNGQLANAKQELEQVVKQYPNSAVAQLASQRLLDINQQMNANSTNNATSNSNNS